MNKAIIQLFSNCCRTTTLPIILKGILTAEDAHLAVEHGVNGIMVSNHGARQLNDVPATVGDFLFKNKWFQLESIRPKKIYTVVNY